MLSGERLLPRTKTGNELEMAEVVFGVLVGFRGKESVKPCSP
jgi:hypothetical protein